MAPFVVPQDKAVGAMLRIWAVTFLRLGRQAVEEIVHKILIYR